MGNDLSECSHGNCFEVAYHFFNDNYSQGNFCTSSWICFCPTQFKSKYDKDETK